MISNINEGSNNFLAEEYAKKYKDAKDAQERSDIRKEFCNLLKKTPDQSTREELAKEFGKLTNILPSSLLMDANQTSDERKVFIQHNHYVAHRKDQQKVISNFILRPLLHVKGKDTSKRHFLLIGNNSKPSERIEFETDQITSPNKLNSAVLEYDNFWFNGTGDELMDIIDQWNDSMTTARAIEFFGLDHKTGAFVFGDAVFHEGELYKAEKTGLIQTEKAGVFAARLLGEASGDDDEEEYNYQEGRLNLREWTSIILEVYKDKGTFGIAYVFMCAFRDIIIKKYRAFPYLALIGGTATGKSSFALSFQRVFVNGNEGFNLGIGTPKGFIRKISASINHLIWFDELGANMRHDFIESLKSAYDNGRAERAAKSNDNRRVSSRARSGGILTGQYSPEGNDNALYERCIDLSSNNTTWTHEERLKHEELIKLENEGLNQVLIEVLKYRDQYFDEFEHHYQSAFDFLQNEFPKVKDRLIKNYSLILATGYFLIDHKVITTRHAEIEKVTVERVTAQLKSLSVTSTPQKIMNAIREAIHDETLKNTYAAKRACDTRVTFKGKTNYASKIIENCSPEDELICLFTSRITTHINNHLHNHGEERMSENNIHKMLREHPAFAGSVARFQVGKNQASGHALLVSKLGIEVPSHAYHSS